jgi:hypothetical protein
VACHCECPTGLRFRAPNLRHYKLLLAVDPDQGTEQVVVAGDKLFLWPILRLEDDVVDRGLALARTSSAQCPVLYACISLHGSTRVHVTVPFMYKFGAVVP